MPRFWLIFPLFLSFALGTARADDASKLAKAREYFALTHTEQISEQVVNQVTNQANQALLQALMGAKPTPDQQRVVDEMEGQMRAILQRTIGFRALEPEYARLLAAAYTEQELDQILAFYRSPAGQALVEKTPALLQQTSTLVQERVGNAAPELQEVIRHAMEQVIKATPPPPTPKGAAPSGKE